MKKSLFLLPLLAFATLSGCGSSDPKTITIAASELPHAKILNECIAPLVAKDGYTLKVTTLDWTLQNDAVAHVNGIFAIIVITLFDGYFVPSVLLVKLFGWFVAVSYLKGNPLDGFFLLFADLNHLVEKNLSNATAAIISHHS